MILNSRHKLALRLCACAMSIPALAQALFRGAAHAQAAAPPPGAHAAAPTSNRLFADSKIVTRDRFSVEVVGHGPDVILIPGLGSSRETYRRTAEQLRGRYRLHLVQIAGFAGEPSRANAEGPFLAPVMEDLDRYIHDAGLRKPALIGHSLGGVLGLSLAQQHPDDLGRLMIVDALPFFGVLVGGPTATGEQLRPMAEQMGARVLPLDDKAFAQAQAASFRGQMAQDPAVIDRIVAWSVASDRKVLVRAMVEDLTDDLRPGLGKVTAPVTILYEASLEPMMQSGYAPLPTKKLVVVPNALHFIMYDQPAAFDSAVEAFLKP